MPRLQNCIMVNLRVMHMARVRYEASVIKALGPRYRDRQILDNRTDTAKDERKPEDRDAKKQAPEGH
jgi:hypothetical protein